MHRLHLDIHLHFNPPMADHGPGVVLTRDVELPFVPFNGLALFSANWEDCPTPEGMELHDVVWDVDREVFLAHVMSGHEGLPVGMIPLMVADFVGRGWRLGSYRDAYEPEQDLVPQPFSRYGPPDDWADAEGSHQECWKGRSAKVNRVVRALIRYMVQNYSDERLAYAWDQTGRFFHHHELRSDHENEQKREFTEQGRKFEELTKAERNAWREKVLAKYPSLEALAVHLINRQNRSAPTCATNVVTTGPIPGSDRTPAAAGHQTGCRTEPCP